ncbi:hypothetical protein PHYPSEUDO_004920 [Phytophthora pseudosyringae]|uniref:Uncharacterized protein n=1 Tax=Phytophthora pseudosyringae TaxID=221518 RepID=A0A8T1WDU6_9STRA|nr:hypothetical protein PHYPSEUDO_004920 [Phytophthora pseudosyringae]
MADQLPQEVTVVEVRYRRHGYFHNEPRSRRAELDAGWAKATKVASGGAEDGSTKARADLRSEIQRTCGVALEITQHGRVCARKHRAAGGATLERVNGGQTQNGRRTDGTEHDSQTTSAVSGVRRERTDVPTERVA